MKQRKNTIRSNKNISNTNIKHQRVGNLNLYSEEISKIMVEKIISLAVSTSFAEKINSKIIETCINDFISKIENLIIPLSLSHEVDDLLTNNFIESRIEYLNTDTNKERFRIKKHNKCVDAKNFDADKEFFNYDIIKKDKKIEIMVKNLNLESLLDKSEIVNNKINILIDNQLQFDAKKDNSNYWGIITQPKSINIDRTTDLNNH